MFNLKDRVVVVTGSSSGLGRQMAKGFAGQGATLVLLARRKERLEELAKELEAKGTKVLTIQCDVTNTKQVNEAAALAEKIFGKVDVLVNCAGSAKNAGVLNMTDEEWDFTMDVDLKSVFLVTRAFANIMKKHNYGRIINIASMYGLVGNTAMDTVAYHSSKGGVVNFTRAVAAELARPRLFGVMSLNENVAALGQDLIDMEGENAFGIGNDAFGADADRDLLIGEGFAFDFLEHGIAHVNLVVLNLAVEEVDRRGAEEVGDEAVGRFVVNLLREAALLFDPELHDDDFVGNRHRFFLVVGNEDGRDAGRFLNPADFLAGLETESGIEVGERLVEEKDARVLDEGPGNGDTLLLAAGELVGFPPEIFLDLDDLGRFPDEFVDLDLGELPLLDERLAFAVEDRLALGVFDFFLDPEIGEREGDVLVNSHVRIKRIVLENEPDAALFRRKVGNVFVAEPDFARARLAEAGDHVESRRLAAAGRAEKRVKLPVRNR